jgi:hypothetical protein
MLIGAACAACMVGGLYFTGKPFDWRYGLLLGYFILVTFFLLRWQEDSAGKTNIFIRRFMAGLVLKLMGSLILLAVLLKTAPGDLVAPLSIIFVALYVVFMGWSVARLMKVVKTSQPAP